MTINNGRFTINTDGLGNIWISETIKSEKSGKVFHKNYGYHKSIKDCLKAFHRYRTLGSDARTTEQALKAISTAFDEAQRTLDAYADSFVEAQKIVKAQQEAESLADEKEGAEE